MSTIERHVPGTPSWVDLMTPDLEGARKFYGGLFGWSFVGGDDPQTGNYTMAQVGGRNAAGIGKLPEGDAMPSAWSVYFEGEDADKLAASIRENGGQIVVEPMDVMGYGRMVVAVDATGAVFGIWQPKSHTGAEVVDEPGAMCWHEVNTRDMKKAAEFYGRVFGLEARKLEDAGIEYSTLHKGPKIAGGILQMNAQWPAEVPPHWMSYFAVDDVDASLVKLQELGGKILVPAFDTPYGRQSVVADPFGATFTIMKPSPLAQSM